MNAVTLFNRMGTTALIAGTISLLGLTGCSRFTEKPLPLRILFTNEVNGYLEACG
jgi:hypothetical protein